MKNTRKEWKSYARDSGPLRRRALALALASVSVAALAAPGTPGIPGPAQVLFVEDFQSQDRNTPIGIEAYKGGIYTADDYWVNRRQCNGIVYSLRNIPPSSIPPGAENILGCPNERSSHLALENLLKAMAKMHGVPEDEESLLSSFTLDQRGPPGVVMETLAPVSVPLNRFITAGVDVANTSCNRGPSFGSDYTFFLIGSTQTLDLNFAGFSNGNVCTQGTRLSPINGNTKYYAIKGNNAQLTDIGSAKLRVRNEKGDYEGNDAAIDNLTLYDVTPQLDHQFARGTLANGAFGVNKPARMTLTVTNTDDLLEKKGWSFIENLPTNLSIAPTPNLQSDCILASAVAPTPGSGEIRVGAGTLLNAVAIPPGEIVDRLPGPKSCTVSFDVTSAVAGTYSVNASNVSSYIGLHLPGVATVTFVNEPIIRLQKALSGSRIQDSDQFLLSIAGGAAGPVQATTEGTGANVSGPVAVLNPATAGTVYTLSEASAGSTNAANYASRYSCTNATANGQTPNGNGTSFSIEPDETDDLTCTFTNSVMVADLQVVKTPSVAAVKSGELVTFSIVATNAGPAVVNNAVLRDVPGAGLDCATPSLNATCVADGATCPGATVPVSVLTGVAGVTIPSMPVGGRVTLSMQCRVTASGTN